MWKIILAVICVCAFVFIFGYLFVKKGWHRTVAIAFSMYSKIPMPHFEWREEDMKYTLCFFPWVGGIIGVCVWLVGMVGINLELENAFLAAVISVLPLLISGGIHMDGYLDTIDALSSWQTKERRLEILKDPHTGAFAIIGAGIYLLLNYGCVCQLLENGNAGGKRYWNWHSYRSHVFFIAHIERVVFNVFSIGKEGGDIVYFCRCST